MSLIEFNTTVTNASGKTTTAPRAVSSANPLPVTLSATPSIDIGEVNLLGDDGNPVVGSKADAAYAGTGNGSLVAVLKGIYGRLLAGAAAYLSPNGTSVETTTSLCSLFSDDFGGSAVQTALGQNWDVIDGGLAAVTSGTAVAQLAARPVPGFSQAKIGSGTTGMSDSVSGSQLTVTMGTALGAERWYLSQQVFAGKEDIVVVASKSQALAANSIFIGLVEVDPVTFIPLLNANFAADGNGAGEFTNRGGIELGQIANLSIFAAEAIGDSSSVKAVGNQGNGVQQLTFTQEYLIEIDSRDIIVSNGNTDSVGGKGAQASRVSSQCPNDKKLYKLLMRFRNVTAPGSSTSVVINRILVVDNYEQRVQISSGEGDQIAQKATAVNVVNNIGLAASFHSGLPSPFKMTSAATTNGTNVKNGAGMLFGGYLRNRNTSSERYFKLYNKASAPTVGTDTPVLTIGIPANGEITLGDVFSAYGLNLGSGIAIAVTGSYADSDTTAIGAGDVDIQLLYW